MSYEVPAARRVKMERERVVDSGDPKVRSRLVEGHRVAVVGTATSDDAHDGRSTFRRELECELGPGAFVLPEHKRAGVEGRLEVGLDLRREDEVTVMNVREQHRSIERRRAAIRRTEEVCTRPRDKLDQFTGGVRRQRRMPLVERVQVELHDPLRLDVELRASGDGSDQAGRPGRAQDIAVPTFKPDPAEMRRV
jgi:hypothetical protein